MSDLVHVTAYTPTMAGPARPCDIWALTFGRLDEDRKIWVRVLINMTNSHRRAGLEMYLTRDAGDRWTVVPDDYDIPVEVCVALAKYRLTTMPR